MVCCLLFALCFGGVKKCKKKINKLLTGRGIEGSRVVVGNVVRAVTSPVDVFFFFLLLLLMLILDRPSCTCLVQRIEGPAAARQRRALCVRNKCRPVGPRGASRRRRRRRRRQQPVSVVGIVERFVRSQTPGSSVTLASCGRAIDAAQASVVWWWWWWWWSKKRRGEREKMTKSRNKFIFHYFSSATPSSFVFFSFSLLVYLAPAHTKIYFDFGN